ncbi:2-hydroxychromene-2-carboxylate isomerase [Pseudoluteimonas lycopersici]|uniref:2-hydroxychromene-2-carboxylate isomerase n=1 Tax=Pseudoluteimonas lycopersici TaxID=1324796 RepID=A0A516V6W0_9GAMM|nr:2-hydroxychromene-2-carboxylate isomerase [Lysobacter lycopersici]QDQ74276.1 2-hydroxychromene-2-carboxylate isomerase [Lysobacter lycopersici]
MSAPLDWYFDFISPFAYLQWRRLCRDHPGVALNPKPLLFAALLNHHGQLGPAEIPQKRRHTYRIALWQARELGIPLHFPPAHPFNPLPALRLCLAAADRMQAIDAIFAHLWERGSQGDSAETLADVAQSLGMADPAAAIARDEVKRELQANGEEAIRLGVFGVPTLKVRDELFWGNDATDLALAYARDPAALDAEMRRVDDLPEAIRRRKPA